jgi:uncharacterized membrane protein
MKRNYFEAFHFSRSKGQKIADTIADVVGSWKFIIIQSGILFAWIVLNVILPKQLQWDPYTFTLLNLFLSFQAAYTAPIIMMSQNRQNQIDRKRAEEDYHVNKQAEKEIEIIQTQIDELYTKLRSETSNELLLTKIKKELAQLRIDLRK